MGLPIANWRVLNGHTLGFYYDEQPHVFQIVRASVLRGATFSVHPGVTILSNGDSLTPATAEDFNSFGVQVPPCPLSTASTA